MAAVTPEPVTRLIEAFSQLPGIGPKTASRLTFYLLRRPAEQTEALADALRDLKQKTVFCSTCFNITEVSPCAICQDEGRDRTIICVVEEPLDVLAIDRTGEYQGLYHVLHGSISPVEGIGPEELRIKELMMRLREPSLGESSPGQLSLTEKLFDEPGPRDVIPELGGTVRPVEEVLLATNPNLEGEATAMYLARLIQPLGIRVTRLARGLPVGGDLEYADAVTLSRALEGRREM
jgi:recombination protein RecR